MHEWKRLNLPPKNANVVIAVSGGADSTALFLTLDELIHKKKLALRLVVAHLNHGLRGKASAEDARLVKDLATGLGYHAVAAKIDTRKKAARSRENLEQAARQARYEFLARIAGKEQADVVLTGHTMDDQAETVLLNLIRGSGTDGLSGMESVRPLNEKTRTRLARPLLAWARRSDTEEYCRMRRVKFCTDAMNLDPHYSRVRVRQQLLPLMKMLNVRIVEALSRTADLLREDKAALNAAATRLLELAGQKLLTKSDTRMTLMLDVDLLRIAPVALRRRVLRQWIAQGRGHLRRIELVHILAVESLLAGNRGGRTIELPGGAKVSRKRGWLQLHR